ncbi:FAD dependent oxidoreductase [Caballeronia cordobensis]|uniref:FAD dependent oxidoreductase n=1 Tax=Caballeronia cordobensis TaxID=1353886 RepID=A0A158IYZ7_CABCO|nr:glycerol-3-phosphate dehydrogenase/oxidase [Caballeronia cordobensis]SAL61281.1 FAD dependent oxidoreductase [Caballeronia cordobensis]
MHSTTPPERASLLRELDRTAVFDVVVIGGGASGLGTAVDAASRGYRTLLLEARDFAKGTSSKATKLVHGGVRYLAQGNVPLVREALRERGLLARNAPHLVRPLGFIVPAYRTADRLLYGAGLKIYDWLAGSLNLAASRSLGLAETREKSPMLADHLHGHALRGGTLYYDGQFDDARLAITLMRTLFDLGGIALNNAAVRGVRFDRDAGCHRVAVEDVETGDVLDVGARCLVNATGVWVDSIRSMADPAARPIVAPSQGVHLTLPSRFLQSRDAILVPRTEDGRVLFVVPWHGHTIVGTTDTPRRDLPLDPRASDEDIDFILATAADYLSVKPTRDDVLSVWAGLRPLVKGDADASTAALSREHTIVTNATGMITVTGGKWTTYRLMAQQVVDLAVSNGLLSAAPCRTASLPLHGATAQQGGRYGADAEFIARLPGADRVLVQASGLTEAQTRFAVRAELARSVEDVLARRDRALFLDAAEARRAAPDVARIVAEELGRSATWEAEEAARFDAFARGWML